MFGMFTVIHIIVLVSLIGIVLIQSGRGGGLAGTFGDTSASQAIFGGRGANTLLTRATAVLGAAFFITSMMLAFLSTSGGNGTPGKSLIQQEAQKSGATATAPAGSLPAAGTPAAGTAPAGARPAAGLPAATGGATPAPAAPPAAKRAK